jgi:hypothetical protein
LTALDYKIGYGVYDVLMKRAVLLFMLVSSLALSQDQKQSVFVMTGRLWLALPENSKLMYISGMQDGMMMAAAWVDAVAQQKILSAKPSGFFPGDYMKELDALYKDTENLPLPLPVAYGWCNLKLIGTLTKAELEQRLIQMRRVMANPLIWR